MSQRSARSTSHRPPGVRARFAATSDGEIPVVGGREPCPCGSGKRYKACHGRQAARAARTLVRRSFAGLPDETQWVALREILPAATAPLRLTGEHAAREVLAASVLPMALPALVRQSGTLLVGLQLMTSSGDPSADVGTALAVALAAPPGTPVGADDVARAATRTRLQELVDPGSSLEVTVHEGFHFWLEPDDEQPPDPEIAASLERANSAASPTKPVPGVFAGYWSVVGGRTQLRWVLPEPEDVVLDALARLHAAGTIGLTGLGEGTRFLGTFRADGLLVPVWDLPGRTTPEAVSGPAVAWRERLEEALGQTQPLTGEQRRSLAGLRNRQLTLR